MPATREGVATITLNRLDRLNAITGTMLAGLSRMPVERDADRGGPGRGAHGAGCGFCAASTRGWPPGRHRWHRGSV